MSLLDFSHQADSMILPPAHKQDKVRNEGMSTEHDIEFHDEVAAHALTLRGRKLAVAVTLFAGAGFGLFGYCNGVMSALLTGAQFDKVFPQVVVDASHPNHATLQSFVVAVYTIGCLIGALSNLWIGDNLGRRHTVVLGSSILIGGSIIQAASYSYAQLVVARIIVGIGNGLNTSTVPSYHAELSSSSNRGSMIMIEGTFITFGLTISYWVGFALYWASNSSAQWRVPMAFQIIFPLVIITMMPFLPESPRWLIKQNRRAEAMAVISAMEDKAPSDMSVLNTYNAICDSLVVHKDSTKEKQTNHNIGGEDKVPLRELISGGRSQNFRRLVLGITVQCFQQIAGINLILAYLTILFQNLGLSDVLSRVIAAVSGTEFFLSSLPAIFLVDRVGRRSLMLWCAIGQCSTMILMAILGSIANRASQTVSIVLLFVFNTFFAIGWTGMSWLYAAEIVGLRVRGPANAISSGSNWIFNFTIVMIGTPSFDEISWRTWIVFAALNAFIVPVVYFFFPETAGRSLEDLDVVFALAYNEGSSPVAVSLRKDVPLAGTPEAEKILRGG